VTEVVGNDPGEQTEADEDEEHWDERLKKVAKAKPEKPDA